MELEDLAVMVKNGFDHVDKRFVGMDRRFDDLEVRLSKKIDGLELRIGSYASSWDKNFDNLHQWVSELDKRVNKIEDKIVGVK